MDLVLAHVDSQFPPGTGVDAYLAVDFPNGWSTAAGLPAGIVSRGNAAVAGDGSLTIVGLVAGTRYRLAATVGGVLRSVSHYLAPPIDAVPDFGAFADGQFAQWNAAMSEFVGASVDLSAYAPLASPALTGNPTAPTQAPGNNTTRLATTAFVTAAVAAVGSPSTLTSPVTTDPLTFAGALTFSKNVTISTTGSLAATPRTLRFPMGVAGEAGRLSFSGSGTDDWIGMQGNFGGRLQLFSYYGIDLRGTTGTASAPAVVAGATSDPGVSIINTQAAGKALVVKGAASQSTNLQDWQNSAGTPLTYINQAGSLIAAANGSYIGHIGTGQEVLMGYRDGSNVAAGFTFGTGYDTGLFRSAAGVLALTSGSGAAYLVIKPGNSTTNGLLAGYDGSNVYVSAYTTALRLGGQNSEQLRLDTNLVEIIGASTRLQFAHASQAQTTVGAAGGASAPPATPTKYFKVMDSTGTEYVIPAYAAS